MTEAPENLQQVQDNSQSTTENSENSQEIVEVTAEKRGRGRPKGSRDSVPRKRKIIEEPVAQEAPPEPPTPTVPEIVAPSEPARMKTRRAYTPRAPTPVPHYTPLPAQPPPPPPPQPPSPRTLFRQAGETMYHLQTQRNNARRDYWAEQIEKSLKMR